MNKFREKTPIKQDITKAVSRYQIHRGDLQKDFEGKCGYCDDNELWRNSHYEIDHFIPKRYLSEEEKTEYWNLVYSCRFCNNSKRAKWPTDNKDIPNNGKEGFIEPWTEEYGNQFFRDSLGRIIPKNDLSIWMFKNLNLGLKRHSIIWQLEKLERLLDDLEVIFPTVENQNIKDKITQLLFLYKKIIKDWRTVND